MTLPVLHVAIIDTYFVPNSKPKEDGKINTRISNDNVTEEQLAFFKKYLNDRILRHSDIHIHYGMMHCEPLSDDTDGLYGKRTSKFIIHACNMHKSNLHHPTVELHGFVGGIDDAIDMSTEVICIMDKDGLNDNLYALTYALSKNKTVIRVEVDGSCRI